MQCLEILIEVLRCGQIYNLLLFYFLGGEIQSFRFARTVFTMGSSCSIDNGTFLPTKFR